MMKAMVLLGVLAWAMCGVLGYGITKASFEHDFPTPCDRRSGHEGIAVFIGLGGPAWLIAALVCSNFAEHGVMFRRTCAPVTPRGELARK